MGNFDHKINHQLEAMNHFLRTSLIHHIYGPFQKGIVGYLDEHDRPIFVYPEIIGYYLTFLSFEKNVAMYAGKTVRVHSKLIYQFKHEIYRKLISISFLTDENICCKYL